VTGIGGIFLKAQDPKKLATWYRDNLGLPMRGGGMAIFPWRDKDKPDQLGRTAWRLFPTNSTYFGASTSPVMVNYRVSNLERMIEQLRRNGVTVEKTEDSDYGRFTWVTDPEGNRLELWEPKAK
jgi:predicted enzyme related to lactoylglutathione lyase